MNYASATDLLSTARNRGAGKPIGNNTRLMRDGSAIAVVLHGTSVVKYWPTGAISLYTGGWVTVTTKDRINAHTPSGINVSQRKGHWYVRTPQGEVPFYEGITLKKEWTAA